MAPRVELTTTGLRPRNCHPGVLGNDYWIDLALIGRTDDIPTRPLSPSARDCKGEFRGDVSVNCPVPMNLSHSSRAAARSRDNRHPIVQQPHRPAMATAIKLVVEPNGH